ncbi:MAG: hypothetical protein ACR2PS_01520 [Pseudomonadales bacterium]
MSINPLSRLEAKAVLPIPYFIAKVPAGFPSPADDYIDYVELKCKKY